MKSLKMLAVAVFALFASVIAFGQKSKTVVENTIASKNHGTLVAALKAAELVETLSGKGPFTVFAPIDKAFEKLPIGTLETLLKPENKSRLQAILTYHVVAGKLSSKDVIAAVTNGKGSATLTTVQGGKLIGTLEGKNVILTDENGNKSTITTVDIISSNGVIHVIDNVMLPK